MFYYNRNGALGPVREWKLKDCIAVHKFLGTVLVDNEAALSKYHAPSCWLYMRNNIFWSKYVILVIIVYLGSPKLCLLGLNFLNCPYFFSTLFMFCFANISASRSTITYKVHNSRKINLVILCCFYAVMQCHWMYGPFFYTCYRFQSSSL